MASTALALVGGIASGLINRSSTQKAAKLQRQQLSQQQKLVNKEQEKVQREGKAVAEARTRRARRLRGEGGARSLLQGGDETGDFRTQLG